MKSRGFSWIGGPFAVAILCACGLATGLPAVAAAAKKAPLTQVEKELRGWLWDRKVKTRVPLALEAEVRGAVGLRTRSGSVTLATLHTDVDRSGRVTYEGRSLIGIKHEVPSRDVRLHSPVGTELQVTGFTLKDDRIALGLLDRRNNRRASLRLWLPEGFQSRMDASDMVIELGRVVDFGPDVSRLSQVKATRQRIQTRLSGHERRFKDGSLGVEERISEGKRLQQALTEAVRAQRDYDRLMNTESSARAALERRQAEVGEDLERLGRALLAARRDSLAPRVAAARDELAAAEASFRAPSAAVDELLRLAAVIVDGLAAVVREFELFRRSGGERLEAEQQLQAVQARYSRWRMEVDNARNRGCPRELGLSADEIGQLLRVPAPDAVIAREIDRCGLSFEPDEVARSRLASDGLGEQARAALAQSDGARTARSDLPELGAALEAVLTQLRGGARAGAGAVSASPSTPTSVNAGAALAWSPLSTAKLDFYDAQKFCRGLATAGGASWRLPSIVELEQLPSNAPLWRGLNGQAVWSGTKRSSTTAWAYDSGRRRKDSARMKFSLRSVVCARSTATSG